MNRRSFLAFGATAAIARIVGKSIISASSADAPLTDEQQKMIALVDKSVREGKPMMFNTNEMGGVTIERYSAPELKKYQDEVIRNIKSGVFMHVVTCDSRGRNCAPNTTLMAPELNQ